MDECEERSVFGWQLQMMDLEKFGKQQLIFIEIGGQSFGIGRQSPFGSRTYSVPVPLLTQSSKKT